MPGAPAGSSFLRSLLMWLSTVRSIALASAMHAVVRAGARCLQPVEVAVERGDDDDGRTAALPTLGEHVPAILLRHRAVRGRAPDPGRIAFHRLLDEFF